MIDLTIHPAPRRAAIRRARERGIVLPTFEEMKHPEKISPKIKERLRHVGLWDLDSANLFRISWKNAPQPSGGLHGGVNYFEIPSALSGVRARIVGLVGKWFPTGAHKVGASYACLVPRLVTGQFDPTAQKAVWPSTGNYCRGGAYNAALLGCESVAILPAGMSPERFEWLSKVAGEVIATPGSESNVKEIFDKTWELRRTRDDVVIFNQFDEMGNHLWHYEVTGGALEEVFQALRGDRGRVAGTFFTSGSAGTLAAGNAMKDRHPRSKFAVGEALQCPTLLKNGFGAHRIEGIGDKHVPWIHDVRETDLIVALDDEDCMALVRLFNDPAGRAYLKGRGVAEEVVDRLDLLGISGVANLLGAIKMAKYYELSEDDFVFTVFTDSMELYGSRLEEMAEVRGPYDAVQAAVDCHAHLWGIKDDGLIELTYPERQRVHNLKYYTWVEQQGRTLEELQAQWYDYDAYWGKLRRQAGAIDRLIEDFNRESGALEQLV
ncbi:MAG TPA: pyridoxal-phosphate dependent enzyme [Synergistaceae bacterium]|nr:pyridoxal-phosphate dependent enzyme [Synergistaceae bacterium]HQF90976.1 pyridoxal-phosphate dependent enzyme [Synergistaceae bacterium]HQH77948.1 pyridoxal-phosphate dependent enzyme [Synergistaceae bacterium]HQK24298.1 pyridoxal-phosphate dependent enzyme [Synergistaceae bacterium]